MIDLRSFLDNLASTLGIQLIYLQGIVCLVALIIAYWIMLRIAKTRGETIYAMTWAGICAAFLFICLVLRLKQKEDDHED